MNKQKGFTLIEVLIVVVIIGVLAALIIPRFLNAPEKAIVAEANQMLGSLIRAQQANLDVGGSFIVITDNMSTTQWNKLQLNPPLTAVTTGSGAKFGYTCTNSSCTAARSAAPNKTVGRAMTGAWQCGSEYTTMAMGGCVVA